MARIYVEHDMAVDAEFELPADAAHHVRTVLRLSRDAELVLFNGDGSEYQARLIEVTHNGVRALVNSQRDPRTESPLDLTLVQSISRGERMDYTIQKAVELGIQRIQPVVSQRTVVRLDAVRADKRLSHWRGIARHAAEQSGRTRLPDICAIAPLELWLAERDVTHRFLLNPEADLGLATQTPPTSAITVIAGPEGGFEAGEIDALEAAGAVSVHLGPRTLRTETAAVTALSIVQAVWGDLARPGPG